MICLQDLPTSVWAHVARALDLRDLYRLSSVSRALRTGLSCPHLWLICVERTPSLPQCRWGALAPEQLTALCPLVARGHGKGPVYPSLIDRICNRGVPPTAAARPCHAAANRPIVQPSDRARYAGLTVKFFEERDENDDERPVQIPSYDQAMYVQLDVVRQRAAHTLHARDGTLLATFDGSDDCMGNFDVTAENWYPDTVFCWGDNCFAWECDGRQAVQDGRKPSCLGTRGPWCRAVTMRDALLVSDGRGEFFGQDSDGTFHLGRSPSGAWLSTPASLPDVALYSGVRAAVELVHDRYILELSCAGVQLRSLVVGLAASHCDQGFQDLTPASPIWFGNGAGVSFRTWAGWWSVSFC